MLLSDMQIAGKIGPDWSILATDISHRVLLSAKEGVYPQDRLREVSPERLRRYCLRGASTPLAQFSAHFQSAPLETRLGSSTLAEGARHSLPPRAWLQ